MENISKEFTYPVTDDQYSQTNEQNNTGTLTYNGPAKKYVMVYKETNKITGSCITEEVWNNGQFNDGTCDEYAVEVDCNEDTLLCAIINDMGGIDVESVEEIEEIIPNSPLPYRRNNPMLPDHVYEKNEITYNPGAQEWVKPFAWKAPIDTWDALLERRNHLLEISDKNTSEDMPEAVYAKQAKYKRYLRQFPELYGCGWTISIGNGGSGYSVDDRLLISDPVFKNGTSAPDILMTVTAVDESGAITAMKKSTPSYAHTYHTDAGTYNNVFYTTSSTGTGAQLNMSKLKLVQPWKINVLRNPAEGAGSPDFRNNAIDNLDI